MGRSRICFSMTRVVWRESSERLLILSGIGANKRSSHANKKDTSRPAGPLKSNEKVGETSTSFELGKRKNGEGRRGGLKRLLGSGSQYTGPREYRRD